MKKLIYLAIGLATNLVGYSDLSIIGFIKPADGLGQIALGVINCLKNNIKINFIQSANSNFSSLSKQELSIIKDAKLNAPGLVSILFDFPSERNNHLKVPKQSIVKFAYSMFEADKVPEKWVIALNSYFDGVIVPDEFLVKVYKDSGVKIPIFVLPLGVNLEDCLKYNVNLKITSPFVFGCSAGFWVKKNHELLIKAFAKEFGNNPKFVLRLHGRMGENYDNIKKLVVNLNLNNVQIIYGSLSRKNYIDFLKSLNCYVLISKAEGFSITPREAMALGIPCILSNNTAHKTICKSGLVKAIRSDLPEAAYCHHYRKYIGSFYNCTELNVRNALKEVYHSYTVYASLKTKLKGWTSQYLWSNLKSKYLSLVKPNNIVLGKNNLIGSNYIETNSIQLYKKYKQLINRSKSKDDKINKGLFNSIIINDMF